MARSVNRARSAVALVGVLCLVSVTMDAQPLDPARGTDEKHPLRTANADPGADWNDRNPGGGANPLPRIRTGAGDWDWGDLFYDGVYATKLLVKNECESSETVAIFVNNLPYLTIPSRVQVPPKSQIEVDATIRMPAEPDPPLFVGPPPQPGWGWVNPPPFTPGFGERFHQPNYADIADTKPEVVVWHPWRPADPGCHPKRETYRVAGHIHFRPPNDTPEGPSRLATPDACQVYWNLGEPPAQLDGRDCTVEFRHYGTDFVERVLPPYIQAAPESWAWLPTPDAIPQMSADALLALKARAEELMSTN